MQEDDQQKQQEQVQEQRPAQDQEQKPSKVIIETKIPLNNNSTFRLFIGEERGAPPSNIRGKGLYYECYSTVTEWGQYPNHALNSKKALKTRRLASKRLAMWLQTLQRWSVGTSWVQGFRGLGFRGLRLQGF